MRFPDPITLTSTTRPEDPIIHTNLLDQTFDLLVLYSKQAMPSVAPGLCPIQARRQNQRITQQISNISFDCFTDAVTIQYRKRALYLSAIPAIARAFLGILQPNLPFAVCTADSFDSTRLYPLQGS